MACVSLGIKQLCGQTARYVRQSARLVSFATVHIARAEANAHKTARMRTVAPLLSRCLICAGHEIKPNTAAGDATTVHVAYTV